MKNMKNGFAMLLLLLISCGVGAQDKVELKQMANEVSLLERIEKKSAMDLSNKMSSTEVRVKSRHQPSITFVGCPIVGTTNLPRSTIEEVSVKTGGLSAQYENRAICQTKTMFTYQ